MLNTKKKYNVLSHNIKSQGLTTAIQEITSTIRKAGDQLDASVAQQLMMLEQLSQFSLGRFLIINRGLNGYWTDYVLTHPNEGRKHKKNNAGNDFTAMESFLLDKAPTIRATQQRYQVFLEQNQQAVLNNATLASIPCGLMGELLNLQLATVDTISLVGIDCDSKSLAEAEQIVQEKEVAQPVILQQADAWQLKQCNNFNLISSNGLNIYEPDDNKVVDLYQKFHTALKPGGILVTSFLTPPPNEYNAGEWQMNKIDQQDLKLQKIIFSYILNAKWQCYRTTHTTKQQLQQAGFHKIRFIYDDAHIFPEVIAIKP